jgi:hypothetical protein
MPSNTATRRILFVGNSYTGRNQLPRMIAEIAAAASTPKNVQCAAVLAGGASLKQHWNAGKVQVALGGPRFDDVVLQEQSTLPVKNAARYHDNVRRFVPVIREHGARIVLYLPWARQQTPERQADLNAAVDAIANEIDALVVPVGPAWEVAQRELPGIALYEDDGSHPTALGSFLAACVFYARLFDDGVNGEDVAHRLGIEPATAQTLQSLASRFRASP